MKATLFILLSFFTYSLAIAQEGILAGKITDENGKPISGATIRVSKANKAIDTHSDEDGLFYTQLLVSDLYRLDVVINGKFMKAKKVYIPATKKVRKYYYLKVVGDKIEVRVDGEDPFMGNKVSKLKNADPMQYHDLERKGVHIMKRSETGEFVPGVKFPESMPSLK